MSSYITDSLVRDNLLKFYICERPEGEIQDHRHCTQTVEQREAISCSTTESEAETKQQRGRQHHQSGN